MERNLERTSLLFPGVHDNSWLLCKIFTHVHTNYSGNGSGVRGQQRCQRRQHLPPPPLSIFINLHIIAWIDLLLLWFWRRLSDGSVTGGCVSKIGISPLPLYLVINIHITVWIDLDGASVATTSSVAALASASGDGGSFLITILNWSDRSGGSGTGRGDSCKGTVRDAKILPFSEVSSEKNFTWDLCAG